MKSESNFGNLDSDVIVGGFAEGAEGSVNNCPSYSSCHTMQSSDQIPNINTMKPSKAVGGVVGCFSTRGSSFSKKV